MAVAQAETLEGDSAEKRARSVARLIRAEVAQAEGREKDALTELSGDPRGFQTDPVGLGVFLHADLLRRSGRTREALEWYGAQVAELPYHSLLIAMCHLRRAEIHEELGERELAVHYYSRFVDLWREADPELQPMVERARDRLTSLQRTVS